MSFSSYFSAMYLLLIIITLCFSNPSSRSSIHQFNICSFFIYIIILAISPLGLFPFSTFMYLYSLLYNPQNSFHPTRLVHRCFLFLNRFFVSIEVYQYYVISYKFDIAWMRSFLHQLLHNEIREFIFLLIPMSGWEFPVWNSRVHCECNSVNERHYWYSDISYPKHQITLQICYLQASR